MARHFTLKKVKAAFAGKQERIVVTVLLLVVAVLAVLCIINAIMPEPKITNPEGTVGNTAGNMNNLGLFCEYNDTVYFANSFEGGALYAMAPDESNLHKVNNSIVQTIMAGGDYLYYFQIGVSSTGDLSNVASHHGLIRCDLKGKHAAPLTDDVVITGQLINDYLYLLTVGKKGIEFYKLRGDKTDKVSLASYAINPACVVDNIIYYNGTQEDHNLFTLDTTNDVPNKILNTSMWYPIVEGNYVYYLDVAHNYRLCRYNFANETYQILTKDRVDCYNIGNGFIYYQKNGTDPQLICMRTDGTDAFPLADGIYKRISMTSQYVYYMDFENDTLYHSPIGSATRSIFQAAMDAVPAKK